MAFRSINLDEAGLLFGKWKISPDTWVITNRWQSLMYLLIGQEKALLIDTGYGEGDLRTFVEQITQKPVIVANTHGHFDHTGGNACWNEAWMTAEAARIARDTFCPQHDEWFAAKPHCNYSIRTYGNGDKIDLGGRVVEIISIPAHSEGSVALLDAQARLLFAGDELESGQVLLFASGKDTPLRSIAAAHKANMQKLKARRSEYDFLCPAHNGTMLEPDTYLDDFIALDNEILSGTAQVAPDTAGFAFPTDTQAANSVFTRFGKLERVQHGQASIVYIKGEMQG